MSDRLSPDSDVERVLRTVPMFDGACEEDIRQIARLGFQRAVEEGGHLFLQQEAAEYLYILLRGRIKLCQITPDGQQVNVRTILPGELFGAIGAVTAGARYPVCAEALEDSVALAIPSTAFRQFLLEHPNLSLGLMRVMTTYIQEMQARYREMATEKAEQRIARVLLRLAGQTGKGVKEGVLIELSFSRQDLAEMAGTTLYTVSRTLSAWEKRGMILTGRERIILSHPHAVMCIAEGLEIPPNQ
jgi:CRP-like cAMP-binding protein